MTDDKNIIRYLDGEMTADERLDFEKEISGKYGFWCKKAYRPKVFITCGSKRY